MEKPKRPLSSFNLFYRYKRALVLEKAGDDPSKEDVHKILSATAGLEEETLQTIVHQQPPFSDEINMLRRTKIREVLKDKILPINNGRRRHRKSENSCGISFSEMGNLMTTYWKGVDSYGREVFEELSEEGRQIYRVQMDEYNKLNPKEPQSAPDDPKLNNSVAKKSVAAHSAAAFPLALPLGTSIPVHMMSHNLTDLGGIAAFQRIPSIVPTLPSHPHLLPVVQLSTASKFSPKRKTKDKKKEAAESTSNMDILAAAAADAAAESKRNLPKEPKRSLPLKKRFKRP
jgi:hypothetical protein